MGPKEREAMAGNVWLNPAAFLGKTRNTWFVSGNPSHSGIQTTSMARMEARIFEVRGVFRSFELRIMDIGIKYIHTVFATITTI